MSLSDAEARKNRRELMKQIAAEHKRKDKAKLAELRAHIRGVKVRRKEAMCKVVGACRRGRVAARARARQDIAAIREAAKAAIRQVRYEQITKARAACKARKEAVKRSSLSATKRRRELLAAERGLQRELKRIEGWSKERHRARRHASAKEARQESDDAVRANVPPELHHVWNRVKKSIHGSSRQSRTEAFLHYVEENPNEVVDAQEELAQREIAKLIREEAALRRASRAPRHYRPTAEEIASVPF